MKTIDATSRHTEMKLRPLGWLGSFAVYLPAALLMIGLTKYLIPYLSILTGQETILFWFIVGGAGIFVPLIVAGILILRAEGYTMTRSTWTRRLRFRSLTSSDLIRCGIGLIAVAALSGLLLKGLEHLTGPFDPSPAFMSFEP